MYSLGLTYVQIKPLSMQGKGGPFCEFRIRVQGDRSVMFEAVKNPLQFLTFGENGHPDDVRGILDKEKTRRFFVFCKVSNPT